MRDATKTPGTVFRRLRSRGIGQGLGWANIGLRLRNSPCQVNGQKPLGQNVAVRPVDSHMDSGAFDVQRRFWRGTWGHEELGT